MNNYKNFKLISPSIFLGLYYLIIKIAIEKLYPVPTEILNLLISFNYLVLPIVAIFEIVRRKRKYFKDINKNVIYYLLPGFVFSIEFSYGWFAMGHGYGFMNYLIFIVSGGLWIIIVSLLLSGGIGLLFNYIWNKFSKDNY